ncbi:MAG: prephenate dehydrogenase/arogenate dehydrogenase family protein [Theionarchaea archaeon]|nr:prephenate dehydrogenase/arogenate dehydrogenase family protein [Theionarchaea archaeon]MBU7035742.1 prephenate dehydrogenase/arogenate dehydrogenase family protein [Theionarchaea archaeon]MBU7041514.1 prephenate dehydrogenase/arogenate dehydrogenase family protein [Theionarchaea archaeon]
MRVGIVGGYGKMGQWFCRNLSDCDIAIYGRDSTKTRQCAQKLGVRPMEDIKSLLDYAEMIIVSVPLSETASMLERIKDFVPAGKKICDIASLKSKAVQVLSTYPQHIAVSSVHPLFGPGSPGFNRKKVIIVPVESRKKESDFFCTFFKEQGASVMVSDAVSHDRMMALTLSLPHFLGYLFSSMILHHPSEAIHQFEGTSFKYLFTFSKAVLQEDPLFYFELMQNPQVIPVLDSLIDRAETLKALIATGDRSAFLQCVGELHRKLTEKDLSEAYALFNRLTH